MPSSQATAPLTWPPVRMELFLYNLHFCFLNKIANLKCPEPDLPFSFRVLAKPRPGDLVHLAELERWPGTWW